MRDDKRALMYDSLSGVEPAANRDESDSSNACCGNHAEMQDHISHCAEAGVPLSKIARRARATAPARREVRGEK